MKALELILCALVLAGCETTPNETDEPLQETRGGPFESHAIDAVERVWTQRFVSEDWVVADDILVEGPRDLLQHFVTTLDPDVFEHDTWTTTEGLRIEMTVKPEVYERVIYAYLDGWTIAARKRLRVLQKPTDAPVTIQAIGNAHFLPAEGSSESELTGARLTFRGEHGRR